MDPVLLVALVSLGVSLPSGLLAALQLRDRWCAGSPPLRTAEDPTPSGQARGTSGIGGDDIGRRLGWLASGSVPAQGQAWRKPRKRGQPTKLYELRLSRGWTMQEVSEWSGIPPASYARLERGQVANPRLRPLRNLALLFEVELDELLQDDWRQWMQLHEEAPMRKPLALPRRKSVE